MNFIHLIYVPFTGTGLKPVTDEWLKVRIEIFKNYTLKSLLNQKNKEFRLWLSFRIEEWGHSLVDELEIYMTSKGINYFITWEGLMYYDDRNLDQNRTLDYRLKRALAGMQDYIKGYKYVLMTRLDSDDMLHKNFTNEVQLKHIKSPKKQAIVCKQGYVYSINTGELALWQPKTNPPFHTIVFLAETFFNAKKHLEYYKDWTTHEDTTRVFDYVTLPDGMYCVGIHKPENHISTMWNHNFRGELVEKAILKDFGL